jgi:hypothetical protein
VDADGDPSAGSTTGMQERGRERAKGCRTPPTHHLPPPPLPLSSTSLRRQPGPRRRRGRPPVALSLFRPGRRPGRDPRPRDAQFARVCVHHLCPPRLDHRRHHPHARARRRRPV